MTLALRLHRVRQVAPPRRGRLPPQVGPLALSPVGKGALRFRRETTVEVLQLAALRFRQETTAGLLQPAALPLRVRPPAGSRSRCC